MTADRELALTRLSTFSSSGPITDLTSESGDNPRMSDTVVDGGSIVNQMSAFFPNNN